MDTATSAPADYDAFRIPDLGHERDKGKILDHSSGLKRKDRNATKSTTAQITASIREGIQAHRERQNDETGCEPAAHPADPPRVDRSRYRDFEHSEKPEDRLLRITGQVPRFSGTWKEPYKKRTATERWFSNAKRSRLLDSHRHLRQAKIGLHATTSLMASLLTMQTHSRANDYEHLRHMKIRTPRRRRRGGEQGRKLARKRLTTEPKCNKQAPPLDRKIPKYSHR